MRNRKPLTGSQIRKAMGLTISTPSSRRGGQTRAKHVRLDKLLGRNGQKGDVFYRIADVFEREGEESGIEEAQKAAVKGVWAKLGALNESEIQEVKNRLCEATRRFV